MMNFSRDFRGRIDIALFSEMDSRLRGNDIEVSFIRVIRSLFVSFVFQSFLFLGCGYSALCPLVLCGEISFVRGPPCPYRSARTFGNPFRDKKIHAL